MAVQVVQLVIDDSSDKQITGIHEYRRDCGGVLVPPSGSALPTSPVAGEIFYLETDGFLYRRNSSNTAWDVITGGGAVTGTLPPATGPGQLLFNVGGTFQAATPMTSLTSGWLMNDQGYFIVG